MFVYRYEPRYFKVGEVILPDLDKDPELIESNRRVEAIINQVRPELKDIRSRALYTSLNREQFDGYIHAGKRGFNILKDRNFYKLKINASDIMFEGDLKYYTLAQNQLNDPEKALEAVKKFVAGKHMPMEVPSMEILVPSAIVAEILYERPRTELKLEKP